MGKNYLNIFGSNFTRDSKLEDICRLLDGERSWGRWAVRGGKTSNKFAEHSDVK